IAILYYAFRDKRTSGLAKLPAVLSLIYLLNPLDLIPEFIPFLGYMDDLVIVPLLLSLSIRLLPADVKEESILKANTGHKKFKLLIFASILFIIAWMVGIFFLVRYIINKH